MSDPLSLILKHRQSGALLDANLLLVYVVGKYDKDCLRQFHHTKQYTNDFGLIKGLVEFFSVLYTTPNVLTEVSNLGGKLKSEAFFSTLKAAVLVLKEQYCASSDAVATPGFEWLGLTDAGIMRLAANEFLVLTADWPLYNMLVSKNVDAVNINHLRQIKWSAQLQAPRFA
jgi:rRNA maturation endonuclease Nob1